MVQVFIHRPVLSIVISLVIIIAGGMAITGLPVAQYPQISLPTVVVGATYPGANSQVVEESVAIPIEQEVNGAENMIYMSSKSMSDGRYELTCTFEVGTDLDIAAVQVQNRVSKAQARLPGRGNQLRRIGGEEVAGHADGVVPSTRRTTLMTRST